MKRYQVRAPSKSWSDKGPDLLRHIDNAQAQLRTLLDRVHGYYVREAGADWGERLDRGPAIRSLETWNPAKDGAILQIGRMVDGKIVPVAIVRYADVKFIELANCTRDTSVGWSLVHYAFPNVVFAGGYVYKETFPGFWSDHAWGTAFDGTPRGAGVTNDGLFDWSVRMAASGNMECDMIIGSKGGKVHNACAPDWAIRPGGGDDSHEWHVHYSIVDHDGAKPPRRPMVP